MLILLTIGPLFTHYTQFEAWDLSNRLMRRWVYSGQLPKSQVLTSPFLCSRDIYPILFGFLNYHLFSCKTKNHSQLKFFFYTPIHMSLGRDIAHACYFIHPDNSRVYYFMYTHDINSAKCFKVQIVRFVSVNKEKFYLKNHLAAISI